MRSKRHDEIFIQLEQQRENILARVRNLKDQSLTSRPRPGKWNILEILTHLLTAEKLSLSYMQKKSKGINELQNSGIYEKIKVNVFILSQVLPLRYKAPKVVVENTIAMPLPEIEKQWNILRNELKMFIDTIPDEHLKRKIYKHPFLGRLDVRQALITTREHIGHHTPQILRLIKR